MKVLKEGMYFILSVIGTVIAAGSCLLFKWYYG